MIRRLVLFLFVPMAGVAASGSEQLEGQVLDTVRLRLFPSPLAAQDSR